jgi:hypothetical protein
VGFRWGRKQEETDLAAAQKPSVHIGRSESFDDGAREIPGHGRRNRMPHQRGLMWAMPVAADEANLEVLRPMIARSYFTALTTAHSKK